MSYDSKNESHPKNDPRLDRYLDSLERALRPLSVSDRSEIITEIKSHVLSALERDPSSPVRDVLSALGEPEVVANRYLIERKVKPVKPPVSPIVKWLVIGFLGTLAIPFLFLTIAIFRFAPMFSWGQLRDNGFLGYSIEIDGRDEKVRIGPSRSQPEPFSGERTLEEGQKVSLNLSYGDIEIKTTSDSEFKWDCVLAGDGAGPKIEESDDGLSFTIAPASAKCLIQVPRLSPLKLVGSAGTVKLSEPGFDVDLSWQNGLVKILPAKDLTYTFDLKVTNGRTDEFLSTEGGKSIQIKVQLENGYIEKIEEEK